MGGYRVEVTSDRMYPLKMVLDSGIRGAKTDIGALASAGAKTAAVMVWNYHDNDLQGPAEPIQLTIKNISAKLVTLTHYRIDKEHSNSYEVWKKMGSPQNPTAEQILTLQKAGQLQTIEQARKLTVTAGNIKIDFGLPRQGVSLIRLNW